LSVKLLILIPCFNEASTIAAVVHSIPRNVPGIDRVDVLVIDDGSADGTAVIASEAGASILRHSTNRGVGAAFHSGVAYAIRHNYAFAANIDGDGQFDPQDIPRLLAPLLADEADMTTGSRFKDRALTPAMPRAKLFGNHAVAYLVSKLLGGRFFDVSCGFRCYSRQALLRLNLHGRFTYTQETFVDLKANGMRIVEVPVVVRYFSDRTSRVANSLVKYAINSGGIIFRAYRDYYPLKFFGYISLALFVPAAGFAALFFGHFILTGRFSGYLFAGMTAGFLLLLSILFLIIAIVADMLDRIRGNQERILYILKLESRQIADPNMPRAEIRDVDEFD
jgi:glycosyltransferase involved in cell wall biosynthesis